MNKTIKYILIFSLFFIFLNIKPVDAEAQTKTVEFFINNTANNVTANTFWNSTFKIQLPESGIVVRNAYIEILGDWELFLANTGLTVYLNGSIVANANFTQTGEAAPIKIVVNASSLHSINNNNVFAYVLSIKTYGSRAHNLAAKAVITYDYDDISSTQLKTVKFFVNSTNTTIASGAGRINIFNIRLAEENISVKNAFFELHGVNDGVNMTLNTTLNGTLTGIGNGGGYGNISLPGAGEQLQINTLVNASSSAASLYDIVNNTSTPFNLTVAAISNNFESFSSIATLTYTFNKSSPVQVKTIEFFVNNTNQSVAATDTITRMNSIFRIQLPESNLQVRNAWFQWGAANDADAALSANVSLNYTSLQLGRVDLSVGALLDSFSFISNMNASSTGVSVYSINNNN